LKVDATREIDEEPSRSALVEAGSAKERRAFAKVRRELSEEELASPGVQKVLLDMIDTLEQQVVEGNAFRDRFHEMDKDCATLKVKLQSSLGAEVTYGVCLSVGSALIGLSASVWDKQPAGWLVLIIGALLTIAGILSKIKK
jgi:hypothetical protein